MPQSNVVAALLPVAASKSIVASKLGGASCDFNLLLPVSSTFSELSVTG
jgi:hypothetical protein